MKAEIIAVGTELLLGQVVNTNATFLSEELAGMGIEVYYQTVVGDNPERLEGLLTLADQRSELIILCGGLGPTEDDLTKEVVAKHVGETLVQDEAGYRQLKKFFQQGRRTMTENNLQQVEVISGSIPLPNETGLAIGCLYKGNQSNYLLLPGPPSELRPMFQHQAKPLLNQEFPSQQVLVSKVLRFYGIGESALVTELADLIAQQSNPTIAPYAKPNEVTLRLTASVTEEAAGLALIAPVEAEIMKRVGRYFYGVGDENSLEATVVGLLKEKKRSVSAAESLTGGAFQATLASVPGVSAVFPGGFVTYSPETKSQFLEINPQLLAEEGVVSEACAVAMAEHARQKAQTDYALSFTGVAGPDMLEGKEPGTVWIALASSTQATEAVLCHFTRDRSYIRHSAVLKGLDLLRQALLAEK